MEPPDAVTLSIDGLSFKAPSLDKVNMPPCNTSCLASFLFILCAILPLAYPQLSISTVFHTRN
jgi:hypothetical protein